MGHSTLRPRSWSQSVPASQRRTTTDDHPLGGRPKSLLDISQAAACRRELRAFHQCWRENGRCGLNRNRKRLRHLGDESPLCTLSPIHQRFLSHICIIRSSVTAARDALFPVYSTWTTVVVTSGAIWIPKFVAVVPTALVRSSRHSDTRRSGQGTRVSLYT